MAGLSQKIEALRDAGLHDICFRNAGVGLKFYEGPRDAKGRPSATKHEHLRIYPFKPTLEEAVDAELERLDLDPSALQGAH